MTIGNGTVTARTAHVGPITMDTIRLVLGSSTNFTGNLIVSTSDTNLTNGPLLSTVRLFDTSATATWSGLCDYVSAGSVGVRCFVTSAAYSTTNPVTSSIPFTWTTNDEIVIAVAYLI